MNSDEPLDFRKKNLESRKMLEELKKALFTEALGKSFAESLPISEGRGDEADQAKGECTRELYLLLKARDREKLRVFDRALEKIGEGTYGICEECDDPIGTGRLKAMPLARFCVSCQSKLEKEQNALLPPDESLFPDEESGVYQ
jgi:DnaK suppressor protein